MKTETQPTAKHTEGKLELIGLSDNSYDIFGDDKEKRAEFVCKVYGHDVYKNLANAQRIVKVMNMHDELVDVLRKLRNAFHAESGEDKYLDKADELLKQAE